jgi:hypothetical protein
MSSDEKCYRRSMGVMQAPLVQMARVKKSQGVPWFYLLEKLEIQEGSPPFAGPVDIRK